MKKILVVCDSLKPEAGSGAKVNLAFILNLRDAGYNVKVIHYSRKNVTLEQIECVSIKENKLNILYLFSRFIRVLNRYFKINLNNYFEDKVGFSFTFLNDASSIQSALNKDTSFEPDLVITLSQAASFRPHYALLKLTQWHQKWLAYIHDPYPFHFYPRPYNWVQSGYKQKEKFIRDFCSKAKWVGFPSQLLLEWMESYLPEIKGKGIVIPHQSRGSVEKEIPSLTYFNPNKFNLLHAGNLMMERPVDGLVSGFKQFLENTPDSKNNAQLLLIGPAMDQENIIKDYVKLIPQLYCSFGSVTYDEANWIQNRASVNVIIESKSEISPFLPGKFPNCVVANKPILEIGPHYSEVKRLLGPEYKYVAESEDSNKIEELISELYQQWVTNPKDLQLNRPDLKTYLGISYLTETINNLISN